MKELGSDNHKMREENTMSSVLNIMSTFYFALFFGAFTTAGRMGLGLALLNAGSNWYLIIIEFVITGLISALLFFFVFNLIRKLLERPSSSKG